MKNNIIYAITLFLIFISCNEQRENPNFKLGKIVKISITNESFKKENYKKKLVITDQKKIEDIINSLSFSKIPDEDVMGGENHGFIEVTLTNKKGSAVSFRNTYSVYHGVIMAYQDKKGNIQDFKNERFVSKIENLLYTGETFPEVIEKVNKTLEEK